jgi:tetratricopeptide (TPR) repeat protein
VVSSSSKFGRAALTLCSALSIGAAGADEPPRAPAGQAPMVQKEARARLEQGLVAYEQGRWRAAVEHFKEADRLAPSARLSFNVAKAYEKMNDAPNALAAYRDYLRRSPRAENATETSIRIAELELALQRLGVQQLSVLSTPPGATVSIDDVSRGLTPWTGELAPGPHRLLLRLRDHRDTAREFELPERHAIDIALELAPVHVARPASPPRRKVAPAPAPEPESARPSWVTWTLFGTSAALLIGAGGLELSRRELEHSAGAREQDQFAAQRDYGAMQDHQLAARVLLGVGALAGIAGGVSLYFDLGERAPEQPASLGLGCTDAGCGALLGGSF